LAKLWYPIGVIAPVTIKFWIDLKELWCSGYGWDDVTSEEIQRKWKENLKTMNYLLSLEFDRKLKPTNANVPPEIHGFSDAGDQAYGAVLFLRWELIDGSFVCVPVIIKAFVAPAKKKSIPRLELLDSLTLARIDDACTKMLTFADIDQAQKFLWIDSTTIFILDKDPAQRVSTFRICASRRNSGNCGFRGLPLYSIK
jgi:hypothetical protein